MGRAELCAVRDGEASLAACWPLMYRMTLVPSKTPATCVHTPVIAGALAFTGVPQLPSGNDTAKMYWFPLNQIPQESMAYHLLTTAPQPAFASGLTQAAMVNVAGFKADVPGASASAVPLN